MLILSSPWLLVYIKRNASAAKLTTFIDSASMTLRYTYNIKLCVGVEWISKELDKVIIFNDCHNLTMEDKEVVIHRYKYTKTGIELNSGAGIGCFCWRRTPTMAWELQQWQGSLGSHQRQHAQYFL